MLIYYLSVFRPRGFVRFCTLGTPYKVGKVAFCECGFLWGYLGLFCLFVLRGLSGFFFVVCFSKFLNYVVLWRSFNGCGFRSLGKIGSC